MNGEMIAGIVGVAAALALAISGFRSHRLSFEKTATMVLVWVLVIAVLAFILMRLGM